MRKIILALFAIALCGCEKNTDQPQDNEQKKEEIEKIPEWNMQNTASVCFISTFDDKSLSNYGEIAAFLKERKDQLVLLDRSDFEINSKENGTVLVANELKGIPFFAFNKYEGQKAQGTGIIIKRRRGAFLNKYGEKLPEIDTQTIATDEFYTQSITNDCHIAQSKTFVRDKKAFPFAVVRFDSQLQIERAKGAFLPLIRRNYVLFGTLTKEIKPSFDNFVNDIKQGTSYGVEWIELAEKQRILFVLKPQSWMLRNKKENKQNNNHIVELQLETDVFIKK